MEKSRKTMLPNKMKSVVVLLLAFGLLAARARAEEESPRLDARGDPLPEHAVSRLCTTRLRDGGCLVDLAFTADGKTLVSGRTDGVRIWDAATGKQLRQFQGDDASKSLSLLELTSADGTRQRFALAPDGKWLTLLGNDALQLCEVETGKKIRSFGNKGMWYCSARFSADGKKLAALGAFFGTPGKPDPDDGHFGDERLEIWDATTGRQVSSWKIRSQQRMPLNTYWPLSSTLLGWADEKTPILASFRDNQYCVLDGCTGKLWHGLITTEFKLNAGWTALSHDGSLLASVYEDRQGDRRVRIWDVATGKETRQFVVQAAKEVRNTGVRWPDFSFVSFIKDGKSLVTISSDGTVSVWNVADGWEERRLALDFGYAHFRALAVSPDEKPLAVAGEVAIRLFDLTTGKERLPRVGHIEPIAATAVTADGRTVATVSAEEIILWDAATGRELDRSEHRFGEAAYRGPAIKTTADGRSLLFLEWAKDGQSQAFRKWELLGGKETRRSEWPPGFTWESSRMDMVILAIAPDGKTVAVKPSHSHSIMILLDGETGKELRRFDLTEEHSQFMGAAFTPDSREVIGWTCWGNVVRVWDVGTGRQLRRFVMPDKDSDGQHDKVGEAYIAAVSPNGQRIVFGSQQNFLALYDLATGHELIRSNKLTDKPDVWGLMAFSPNGKAFAWLDNGHRTVHLMETTTLRERRQFTAPQGAITTLTFSADGRTLITGNSDTTALVWDLKAVNGR
jgi:WD40 repeat protein